MLPTARIPPPVFSTSTEFKDGTFSGTLVPKFNVAGFKTTSGTTPLPERLRVVVLVGVLLIVRVAERRSCCVGTKERLALQVAPAVSNNPLVHVPAEAIAKSPGFVPERERPLRVTLELELLLKVINCARLVNPTVTLPKLFAGGKIFSPDAAADGEILTANALPSLVPSWF